MNHTLQSLCLLIVYTNRNAEAFGLKSNYCGYHFITSMCLSDFPESHWAISSFAYVAIKQS